MGVTRLHTWSMGPAGVPRSSAIIHSVRTPDPRKRSASAPGRSPSPTPYPPPHVRTANPWPLLSNGVYGWAAFFLVIAALNLAGGSWFLSIARSKSARA